MNPFNSQNHIYTPNPTTHPPKSINLRTSFPQFFGQIYDQGVSNSCTANAIAAALQYLQKKKSGGHVSPDDAPSRVFIYYLARGGYRNQSTGHLYAEGASIHEAIKGLVTCGFCSEKDWPFQIERVDLVPTRRCFRLAAEKKGEDEFVYLRLDSKRSRSRKIYGSLTIGEKDRQGEEVLQNVKSCLTEGYPVVFGFWYRLPSSESFDQREEGEGELWILKNVWDTGTFPRHAFQDDLPETLKIRNWCGEAISPAHMVLAIGYDDERERVLIQNSRGESWGGRGRGMFWMSYAWIRDYAATWDFWTIRERPERESRGGQGRESGDL